MGATQVSQRGRAFIRAHEGNPLTCYKDPVGIPTIGTGFTMRSSSVRRELSKIGIIKLVPGKTKITKEQSDAIFEAVLDAEFAPAVVHGSPDNRTQNQLDAGASACFNLGAGAMKWKWAEAWRAGNIAKAASVLRSNYNKAGGKKLAGLVRRRKEEANLFEYGDYSGTRSHDPEGVPRKEVEKPALQDPVIREAQELLTAAGFNPGAIDGWFGEKTKAAVIAYQKAHPHLVADGIIGPATLAQLRRDAMAAKDAVTKGGGSVVSTGITAWAAGLPWLWIVGGVAALVAIYFAWKYSEVITRRWNTIRGIEVPV